MNEIAPPPPEAAQNEWAWISKRWPWGQFAWIQLILAIYLHLLNDSRIRRAIPTSDSIETWKVLLFLSGLATAAFAGCWSYRLSRLGQKLPKYKWATNVSFWLGVWIVILIAKDAGKPDLSQPKPAYESNPVAEQRSDGKKSLRSADGQFVVDVPESWVDYKPEGQMPSSATMSDPSGIVGVGLYSEPKEGLPVSDPVQFGGRHLDAFSKPFDKVTVLESTASTRPGRPPFKQTVETVLGGVRTRFVLVYGESSKSFVVVRVWAPADGFENKQETLREILASLKEAR